MFQVHVLCELSLTLAEITCGQRIDPQSKKKLLGQCTSVNSVLLDNLLSSRKDPPCNHHASVDQSLLTCSVVNTKLKTIRQHVAEIQLCSSDNVEEPAFIDRIKLTDQLVRALE